MVRWAHQIGRYLSLVPVLCLTIAESPLHASSSDPSLGIILTTAPGVTAPMREALVEEATRIWARAGVHLTWAPPSTAGPRVGRTLRILAVPRPRPRPDTETRVVGELLRVDRTSAIAMVSLGEAERIVARAAGADGEISERRVGIVLGRAAAHEIGHYLLDTSTHATQGLMRPQFHELEFAEPDTAAFDLDAGTRAWVRQRLEEGRPLGPGAAGPVVQETLAFSRDSR